MTRREFGRRFRLLDRDRVELEWHRFLEAKYGPAEWTDRQAIVDRLDADQSAAEVAMFRARRPATISGVTPAGAPAPAS